MSNVIYDADALDDLIRNNVERYGWLRAYRTEIEKKVKPKFESAYYGTPGQGVTHDGDPLMMSVEGHRSSSTGFNWGYFGSGPYALAHSILKHTCGKKTADQCAMDFKFEVISELPYGEPFKLTVATVRQWVKMQKAIGKK